MLTPPTDGCCVVVAATEGATGEGDFLTLPKDMDGRGGAAEDEEGGAVLFTVTGANGLLTAEF